MNWCFPIVVLEKTLESPLDCKQIKPVNLKRNQPWKFIGRTDAEAEASVLWPTGAKNWLTGKDPEEKKAERGEKGQKEKRRKEEKGAVEDEMVGWHHWLNGHESEQTLGDRRTGKPGVLQSMGLQRAGHDLRLNKNHHHRWLRSALLQTSRDKCTAPCCIPWHAPQARRFPSSKEEKAPFMKGLRSKSEVSTQRQIYRESHSQLCFLQSVLFLEQQADLVEEVGLRARFPCLACLSSPLQILYKDTQDSVLSFPSSLARWHLNIPSQHPWKK